MALTRGQQTFAQTLARQTGLNPQAIGAWLLAEESGGAARTREQAGNHNWLNIGYFDSGPGAITHNQAFGNPVNAANQTAKFLKGQWGGASSSIRGILNSRGGSPRQQLAAIAGSNWASSHYGGAGQLGSLLGQVGGLSAGAPSVSQPVSAPAAAAGGFDQAAFDAASRRAQVASFVAGNSKLLGYQTKGSFSPTPIPQALQQAPDPHMFATAAATRAVVNMANGTHPDKLPKGANQKANQMQAFANSVIGRPYVWGGGHAGFGTKGGFDCSGFVSAVLHAGGYLKAPVDTTALPSQAGISRGAGKYVTIYDRSRSAQQGHVIIQINGQWYEAGGRAGSWGGGGGVMKIKRPDQSYLNSFDAILHPNGL